VVSLAVHLDVADVTLRLALTYVLESHGHRRSVGADDADAVVVDRIGLRNARRPVDTVVVDPVAAACQEALDAVVSGAARTAICSDDPEALADAIEAARRRTVAVPFRIVEEANRAPRLPDRLAATLHLVLAGCSNPSIARQLHQSESTVKRDINTLLRRFAAPNRLALVGIARSAGYGGGLPVRRLPEVG
jgi:DNA-binding NarL/FixJ family response regulator